MVKPTDAQDSNTKTESIWNIWKHSFCLSEAKWNWFVLFLSMTDMFTLKAFMKLFCFLPSFYLTLLCFLSKWAFIGESGHNTVREYLPNKGNAPLPLYVMSLCPLYDSFMSSDLSSSTLPPSTLIYFSSTRSLLPLLSFPFIFGICFISPEQYYTTTHTL